MEGERERDKGPERAARASGQQSHHSRWEGYTGGRAKPSSAAGRGCFYLQHTVFALITWPRCWDTIWTLHQRHPVTPSDGNIPATLQACSHHELFTVNRKERNHNHTKSFHKERSVIKLKIPCRHRKKKSEHPTQKYRYRSGVNVKILQIYHKPCLLCVYYAQLFYAILCAAIVNSPKPQDFK